MPGNKAWWKWTLLLELLAALVLRLSERGLLVATEIPSEISEQYLWLLAVAGVAMLAVAKIRQFPSPIGWRDLLVLGPAIVLVVWWVLDRGMVHIGGYEHSLIANYGWLQLQGMRPHVDFPCTLCPHFYLGIKYAFTWFGVAWRSHVILAAIYAGVSFAWSYFLLRSMDLSKTSAALIALLIQSLCLMMGGHFWYNAVGSTDVIVLFLAALAWVDRPRSGLMLASVTMAMALVLLDKPNSWAMLPCLAIGYTASAEHRYRFPVCVLGALGVVAVVAYLGPFDLVATLSMYARLSKSRPPGIDAVRHSLNFLCWRGPLESTKISAYAATFLTAFPICLWTHRSGWRTADRRWWARMWVYTGALVTGAGFFFTNYELKCTDLALPTVAFAVWVAKSEPWRNRTFGTTLPQAVGVFALWFFLFTLVRASLNAWARDTPFYLVPTEFVVPTIAFGVWAANRRPLVIGRFAASCIYAGALVAGAALVSIDYEPTFSDMAIAIAVVAAIAANRQIRGFNANPRQVVAALGAWLCLFCLCQGLFDGWVRYRVAWICTNDFWQKQMSDMQPATAFMDGVRGSPRLVRLMRDLERTVAKHKNETIFFGPWIEFAYPAFGQRPPEGFPIWWHPGISYFPEDEVFALQSLIAGKCEVLIFLKRETAFKANFYQMPDRFPVLIDRLYTLDEQYETLEVYRLRPKS